MRFTQIESGKNNLKTKSKLKGSYGIEAYSKPASSSSFQFDGQRISIINDRPR